MRAVNEGPCARFSLRKMCGRAMMVAAIALVGAMVVGSAAQAAPAPKLKTFGNGDVTITGADSATIVNGSGEFGGVYLQSKSQSSKALNQVVFMFTSREDVAGGAPRFSVPIDTDGTGSTNDGYAFLDAAGCGGFTGVDTLVSTQSPQCAVYFAGVGYANWDAFAAANPTYRTAPGYIPFIIADQPGNYAVTDIVLR